MPWSAGVFTRENPDFAGANVWQNDAAGSYKIISASRHDNHDQDLADGINAALAKNGSNAMTGDLNLGSNSIVNAKAATLNDEYMLLGQSIKSALLESKSLILGMPDNTAQADLVIDLSPVMNSALTSASYDNATQKITFSVQGGTNIYADLSELAVYAISESDLPPQSNQPNKTLKTNGETIRWGFSGEYTRDETESHTLAAGDKSFITATGAIIEATLPAVIALGHPFTIKNSLKSDDSVRVVNADFIIYDVNQNYAAGDNIILVPGEQVSLRALSATELEIL